jgi:hypothetical protein
MPSILPFPHTLNDDGAAGFPRVPARSMALYPIVSSAAEVKRVLGCGQRIADIQLRIKDPAPDQMESVREEIEEAVKLCAATGGGGGSDSGGGGGGGECTPTRLWVNDHWQLALECGGVYGVHLGHEDLMELLCKDDDSFDQLADSVSAVVCFLNVMSISYG